MKDNNWLFWSFMLATCPLMQAAAAMCVGMGSFADPYEAQGLAHFLGLCSFNF